MERQFFYNSDKKDEPSGKTELSEAHAAIAQQVDAVYDAIGARVLYGVSYAGEDPVRLYAPPDQVNDSPYPNYPG